MTDENTSSLEQLQADYLSKLKQVALAEKGVDIAETEKYVRLIDTEDKEEIEEQAEIIAADVNRKTYIDPNSRTWNPFA